MAKSIAPPLSWHYPKSAASSAAFASRSFGIVGTADPRYNVFVVCPDRYSVWVGEACCIGIDIPYETLLIRLMEFTMRAAIAKSADESDWEHELLRKHGVGALHVFRNGKAVWDSVSIFNDELDEARREGAAEPFQAQNELDPEFYARLDRDLRARWGRLGYPAETLRSDMKVLFSELEHDAKQRTADARGCLFADFVRALQELS